MTPKKSYNNSMKKELNYKLDDFFSSKILNRFFLPWPDGVD